MRLSDSQAKDVLRKWPRRTRGMWLPSKEAGWWIRAQPKDLVENTATPTIRIPGASLFSTQPDGMWIYVGLGYADAVVVEACCTGQNLNDKRSRYANTVRSLVVCMPLAWLNAEIAVQRGGRQPRWRAFHTLGTQPVGDLTLPVRWLRVLYTLEDDLYKGFLQANVPGGHEYFCAHSSLDSYTAQKMQLFLRQMSFASHFYT